MNRIKSNISFIVLAALIIVTSTSLNATAFQQTGQPACAYTAVPNGFNIACRYARTPTRTATALPTATQTRTPVATATPSPTVTRTPLVTATPPVSGLQAWEVWHAPSAHLLSDGTMSNVHEHHDPAPAWAENYSMANFGHPVIYGGDEASGVMENMMKHQSFKGIHTFLGSGANRVELFIRYHAAGNPLDRSAVFHSYEVYARDLAGNISFWQGLYWNGRNEVACERLTRTEEQTVPRCQFIIGAPDRADWFGFVGRSDQWYTHAGAWSWDFSFTILNTTVFFEHGEHILALQQMADHTPMDEIVAGWDLTGDLGAELRLEATHYGGNNPHGGADVPLNQWYCAEKFPSSPVGAGELPEWDLTGAVASQNSCPAGYLPQYKASTFPFRGIDFENNNVSTKDWNVDGVTVPN